MQRLRELILVGVGGAAGATLRWSVAELIDAGSFPWETLVVNIVGCALLAVVTATSMSVSTTSVVAVGFCGGLTTFSTFAVEAVELGQDGDQALAVVYVLTSVVTGLGAFVAGRRAFGTADP